VTDASYVLPLRWSTTGGAGLAELTAYLRWLAERVEVVVVDGSPPPVFVQHVQAWSGLVHHVQPDPSLRFANGKVNGVTTGVRLAAHERVVVADDDVRYDDFSLRRVLSLLDDAELVRPQNYFAPMPWHARWDSARSLLNRALVADYPGTFALRRSVFLAMDGYDGDVLFENLELVRTVRAHGGREAKPVGVYVRRLPPTARTSVASGCARRTTTSPSRGAGALAVGVAGSRVVTAPPPRRADRDRDSGGSSGSRARAAGGRVARRTSRGPAALGAVVGARAGDLRLGGRGCAPAGWRALRRCPPKVAANRQGSRAGQAVDPASVTPRLQLAPARAWNPVTV
jgi:hypothetical protein